MPKAKKNLATRAYAYLSNLLIRGELPPGAKLSERTLSAQCGVSRVPMREAIRMLVEEGALSQRKQSGTYVNAPSRQDLINIYEVREAVECQQVHAALPEISARDKENLLRHVQRQYEIAIELRDSGKPRLTGKREAEFLSHDFAQHLILLRRAGNRYAEQIVTSAFRRHSFFGRHSHIRDLAHVAWTWRYHHRIIEAIIAGDSAKAEFWLRQHIRRSKADALRLFKN